MTAAALIIRGDCRRVLPTLPAGSARTCVTSPPYPWQREYLASDHPDKPMEIGREASLAAYLETIVGVFEEVRRVLAPDGTLWLNLGDKYVTEGGAVPDEKKFGRANPLMERGALPPKVGSKVAELPLKNLIGIPWRVAFALQEAGWILRSDIIWDKPNATPASVTDRPTQSHEYVFMFSKGPRYFYDQDAVREPYVTPWRAGRPTSASAFRGQRAQRRGGRSTAHDYDKGGRNMRSVWRIAAGGNSTGHVAPMPEALARRCILAGSRIGDTVLDPFGGQGTVGRVAVAEGRNATLIELDERSVQIAERLTAQHGLFGGATSAESETT